MHCYHNVSHNERRYYITKLLHAHTNTHGPICESKINIGVSEQTSSAGEIFVPLTLLIIGLLNHWHTCPRYNI